MNAAACIGAVVDALGLPANARVDIRVPKKMLVEQGAPTSTDKRAIQNGIDELVWFAACKPGTVGVPIFADDIREYFEIAVIGCAFRAGAKSSRLIELIHRAIPYPVILITADDQGIDVSLAHKRRAQNEADKVVVDRDATTHLSDPTTPTPNEKAFLDSMALSKQSQRDLYALYDGWIARIEAMNAAHLVGSFSVTTDENQITRRRAAIEDYERLAKENSLLRSQAAKAKQINQRVDLNQKIKAIERAMEQAKQEMGGEQR
ncbi:DUF4391 domain-containing protein [Rhizobium sp. BK176]|uniref:DUF4391 domain-containing protein n=1 Tax=Rhizobium sp. BK176 TaxID=2587071 RepID=UPI0021690E82|nr:DUF4391 domain-containing protein [Rhizobium sp. BK176]MCS4091362.1 hypothetical protein [Rhizobium sp. BK176]